MCGLTIPMLIMYDYVLLGKLFALSAMFVAIVSLLPRTGQSTSGTFAPVLEFTPSDPTAACHTLRKTIPDVVSKVAFDRGASS